MIKKKIIIVLFVICFLLGLFSIFNYMEYSRFKDKNKKLEKEILLKENTIEEDSTNTSVLKSDYEKLEKEKESTIIKYKKWEEKNKKILELLQ